MGAGVGKRGLKDRLAEAYAAQRLSSVTPEVGGRANLLLVGPEQEDEQGLREAMRQCRSVRLRSHDSADGEAPGPCLRISRQFL
jgi:hypothetical protein